MLLNWCCRRLLRAPWTARRTNQSIPKEIGRTDAEADAETPILSADAETPILWPPDAKN